MQGKVRISNSLSCLQSHIRLSYFIVWNSRLAFRQNFILSNNTPSLASWNKCKCNTGTYSVNCKCLKPVVGLRAGGLDIAMLWGRVAINLCVAVWSRRSGLLVGGSGDVGRSGSHGCSCCCVVIVVDDGNDILLQGHCCNTGRQNVRLKYQMSIIFTKHFLDALDLMLALHFFLTNSNWKCC